MAYGRIYIDGLRKKVTAIFDELKSSNELNEDKFIETFKQKYPKDYAMLQYEWEFKIHEYKKNRKGNPKPFPLRPEKILSNMYRNYYFKLVKHSAIQKQKLKSLNHIRVIAGIYGYKIKEDGKDKYNVINKQTKEIEHIGITYSEAKEIFSAKRIAEIKRKRKEELTDGVHRT